MRVIDLFSGCGGFSLGAIQAGLDVVAAFDNDPILSASYPTNFPSTKLMLRDITKLKGKDIQKVAGRVDGIVGGPPCQGFSTIGRQLPNDPRRLLLQHFFRLVKEIRPDFFVMENVRGLSYSGARGELKAALKIVEDEYRILGPVIWNAAEFGAATNRLRLFVVGIQKGCGKGLVVEDIELYKRPAATVRAAIVDLEDAVSLGEEDGFDVWRIARNGRPFEYARALRSSDGCFTGHRTTRHCPQVVQRFSEIPGGGMDLVGRHPRLAWSGRCPTLRAGTGPERGSYQSVRPLHPEKPRVITVREAARLQGFPDDYRFHWTVWHSFRMIGNSVSPFIARAILQAIADHLNK